MRKTTILSVIILLICSMSYGQDTIKQKKNEFVFSLNTPVDFTSLSFGIGYKRAVSKNKFLKINIPNLNYQETSGDYSFLNITGSLSVGFEFRHNLASKLILFHGPNIGYTYQYKKNNTTEPSSNYVVNQNSGNVSYTFGLQFKLNDNVSLSTQLSPNFFLRETKTQYPNYYYSNSTTTNKGFNLDNGVGAISVVFCF